MISRITAIDTHRFATHDHALVEWLLQNGASPNVQSAIDFTPLSAAVLDANVPVAKSMIKAGGDVKQGRMFHCAARSGQANVEMLNILFEAGAPLDDIEFEQLPKSWQLRWDFNRGTPLHVACALGNTGVVLYLLDRGADWRKLNTTHQTPIDIAREGDYDEIVMQLELQMIL